MNVRESSLPLLKQLNQAVMSKGNQQNFQNFERELDFEPLRNVEPDSVEQSPTLLKWCLRFSKLKRVLSFYSIIQQNFERKSQKKFCLLTPVFFFKKISPLFGGENGLYRGLIGFEDENRKGPSFPLQAHENLNSSNKTSHPNRIYYEMIPSY